MQKNINYLECEKDGYHYGEVLNTVCMEPGCLDKALCCSACVQEFHKTHQTKPLKIVVNSALDASSKIKPIEINTDVVTEIMLNHQKKTLEQFRQAKIKVNQYFEQIEETANCYYISLIDQVKIKGSKSKAEIQGIFQDLYKCSEFNQALGTVQKIISLIPKADKQEEQIQQQQLIESLEISNKKISGIFDSLNSEIIGSLTTKSVSLKKYVEEVDIWSKPNYVFSTKFKHPDVTVVSPTIAKGGPNAGYKFIILEPDLQRNLQTKRMAFKIKESGSTNWIAVGMCHKNIIVAKSYSFTYNTLGHGAYMISSNGGTWSNIKSEYNNVVKAFKFAKNDVILTEYNPEAKKIKFRKQSSTEVYDLDFTFIAGDLLYPCVLFYYGNDQVEFLPTWTDWSKF